MPDPGSLVYQGREGTGAATIYQGNPLPHIIQQGALRKKQEFDQAKFDAAQQEKRQKAINDDINNNLGKPGWFQQEDSVSEIEKFKSASTEYAYQNPYSDRNSLAMKFSKDRELINRRIAKRNELQKQLETNLTTTNQNDLIDGDWVGAYQTKIISDKNEKGDYKNRDVDTIDIDRLKGVTNHPRSFQANKAIVDYANDIKNQVLTSSDGKVRATDFGLEYDQNLKKYRFKVDKNGRISDDVVKYILEQDSSIGDRIRWDIAKEQVVGNKSDKFLSMDEINSIDNRFEQIQYNNDPSVVLRERDKIRDVLNQLQQTEIRHDLQVRTGKDFGSGNEYSPINVRLERIRNARNVFAEGYTPNQAGIDAIKGMANSSFGTYPIMDVEPVMYNAKQDKEYNLANYEKDVKRVFKDDPRLENMLLKAAPDKFGTSPTLKITVRTKTDIEGEPQPKSFYVDLSKPESEEVLNAIYEKVPGAEKISNEQLYIEKKKSGKKKGPEYLGNFDENDPLGLNNGND